MLVNSKEMLQKAKEKKQAIFQFNINNLEWTKWILEKCNELKVPLVLRGGSGLSNEILQKCVNAGITKININSDLQNIRNCAIREFIKKNENIIDPRKIISSGMEMFKMEIEHKLNINNSIK